MFMFLYLLIKKRWFALLIDSFLTNGLDQLISFSIYKYEKDTRKISIEMDFATVIEKVKEILGQEDIEDL